MAQRECEECKKVFTYQPPSGFPDKRKYCDECSAKKKAEWEASKGKKSAQNGSNAVSNAVIGYTEGIAKVEHMFQSQYEFGPAGNRHSIKYHTIEELKQKMKELEDAGYFVETVKV